MRLFAAVVPPGDVVEDLDAFLEPRREAGREAGLRWSPPEQWHVTLAFAAEVPEHRLDDVTERLEAAAARRRPFVLRLAGAGALPDVARARVLVADVDAGASEPVPAAAELERLAVGVRTALATAGVAVDGTRFRPHLTLARRNRPADVVRWVRLLEGWRSAPFAVEHVDLVASYLGEGPRGGPRHQPLLRLPLGPSPDPRRVRRPSGPGVP